MSFAKNVKILNCKLAQQASSFPCGVLVFVGWPCGYYYVRAKFKVQSDDNVNGGEGISKTQLSAQNTTHETRAHTQPGRTEVRSRLRSWGRVYIAPIGYRQPARPSYPLLSLNYRNIASHWFFQGIAFNKHQRTLETKTKFRLGIGLVYMYVFFPFIVVVHRNGIDVIFLTGLVVG